MAIGVNDLRAIVELEPPGIDVAKVARVRKFEAIGCTDGMATSWDPVENDLLQNTLCRLSVFKRRFSSVHEELYLSSKGRPPETGREA